MFNNKYRLNFEYGGYSIEKRYWFWPFWIWQDYAYDFQAAVKKLEQLMGRPLSATEFRNLWLLLSGLI